MAVNRDTNFSYSFLALPREKRLAIVAVWDFCRAVDDAVDEPLIGNRSSAIDRTGELDRWRAELDCCYGRGEPQTRQGLALRTYIERFDLSREPFNELVDGVAMDVVHHRFETFDELYQYCLRVGSAVGLICIEIFGYRNLRTRDYAIALGVALQLTNIIRDVRTDLINGRVYFPMEDLRNFDVSTEDLSTGSSAKVRSLLAFQCSRARSYYDKARGLLPREDARQLAAAEIMASIYLSILRRIERLDYDVFSTVVRISKPRKAAIFVWVWIVIVIKTIRC